MCDICGQPLLAHQSRHYTALGRYHMRCEFNLIRQRLGLPLFEEIVHLRPGISYPHTAPTTSRVQLHLSHKPEKDVGELIHFM